MVPGHIRCVNVFLYKFQMSKEGFCVNSVEFQPLAGEFSSLNTHSQGSCCHLVRGCSLDGQLWSCLKYAQILEAENLQIQGKGFPMLDWSSPGAGRKLCQSCSSQYGCHRIFNDI